MQRLYMLVLSAVLISASAAPVIAQTPPDQGPPGAKTEFRYYRLGNTGVQGDWSEALWIGPDGDPWIGGYDPAFEEGGIAKFVQAEDRWIPVSNVDYRIVGNPYEVGAARVRDIAADRLGRIWFGTWTGVLRMDPAIGPESLVRYDLDGPGTNGGGRDIDISPDGKMWILGEGIIVRLDPTSGRMDRWEGGFEHIAVQPKPTNGYYVWAAMASPGLASPVSRFDSATQLWESQSTTGEVGEIASLRGVDVVDDAGNLWGIHSDRQWDPILSLGYRKPDGSWVDVPAPNEGGASYINTMRAFDQAQALIGDATGRVWHWNGNTWNDLGIGGPTNARMGIVGIDMDPRTGVVWTSGDGGAARRDPQTGQWQRYRITNCSQGDNFVLDLSLAPDGNVWTTSNLGPGVGGFQHFDGTRWRGFNRLNHDLPGSGPFPFDSDATFAIAYRRSNSHVALGMPGGGVQEWTGTDYVDLGLRNYYPTRLVEDSLGRLWAGSDDSMIGLYSGDQWQLFNGTVYAGSPSPDPGRPGWMWLTGIDGALWTDGSTIETVTLPEVAHGSAPVGSARAWVGGSGLYLVDMTTKTYRYFGPATIHGTNPRPFAVSPDGILWYGCDEGLCWLNTRVPSGRVGGIFYAPPGGAYQWGGLAWWPQRAELRLLPFGAYELWMTTPSRGITVLKVAPVR